MRKILGLTIAALLVIGLAGVGTWAYFSDTETSTGNTFTAGTLDLRVDSENPWASTIITAGPMVPGAAATTEDILVENIGTLDGDLYMKISSVVDTGGDTSGPNNTSSEPEYVAEGGTYTGSTPNNDNTATDNISTRIDLSCTGTGVTATHIDGQTIAQAAANGYGSGSPVKVADLVGTTGSVTITFGGSLNQNTDNIHQGDVCTFTIDFYLAQDGQTPP